jgi:hypothetical protein
LVAFFFYNFPHNCTHQNANLVKGRFSLKAEKISALIFGLVTSVTAIVGSYILLSSPSPRLTAEVSKYVSYVPPQYSEMMLKSRKLANSETLSALIDKAVPDAQLEQKSELFEKFRKNMLAAWASPFEKGVGEFETMLFISIKNEGSAIAKDVYVDLPQRGLMMIEDDKKELITVAEQNRRYKIPSIRQDGKYKLWVWFPENTEKVDEYAVNIGNDQQTATIEYRKEYVGLAARVADFYLVFLCLTGLMITSFIIWIYETFKPAGQSS